MKKITDYRLAKKLLRTKAIILAISGATWIFFYKWGKDSFDELNKYDTTYEIYSTLTGETNLATKKIKGNEEEVILQVYHQDKDNDGIRQVDTYYFEKDENRELSTYLNILKQANRFETSNIQYHGSSEEYTEVMAVKNIVVDESAEGAGIFISAVGASLVPLSFYSSSAYVEGGYMQRQGYDDYPYTLFSRINLYNQLKESEKQKKLIKRIK